MTYEQSTFEEVRKAICGIIEYEPQESFELTPNEIFCVIEETGIILEGEPINGWAQFESGQQDLSTAELLEQTNIDLEDESVTFIVTDECFKDEKAYAVKSNEIIEFAENIYPELHGMNFIQPFDILLINAKNKRISMIHHEGQLMKYE